MCKILKIPLDGFVRHDGIYIWYRTLLNAADEHGVLPEILVDEEFYFSRCQMAPYRLTFQIGRKWSNVEDFYNYLVADHAFAPGKSSLFELLRGRLYSIRDVRFWVIEKMCRLAEMPMAYLFTPYRRLSRESVFGELSYWLPALSERDAAVVAGFAKLLATNEVTAKNVHLLLAWRGGVPDNASRKASAGRDRDQ